MKWIELSIVCERVATEMVSTLFADFTNNGIIEEDVPEHPEWVKFTIYSDGTDVDDFKITVEGMLYDEGIDPITVEARIVDESIWYNSWQQYIEPTEIIPGLVIKPAWQDYANENNKTVMEIDSALSFGTGAHETTRMCSAFIDTYKHLCDDGIFLDIGTGTGILLLVAHFVGAKHLVGIDIDGEAVAQAEHNMAVNNVEAALIHGDLDHDFHDKASLIVANLTVDPLKILLPQIGAKLTDGGRLIISGIIDERYDEIMPYILADWCIEEEQTDGPWHAFVLSRKERL